jgi:hypothetical protein
MSHMLRTLGIALLVTTICLSLTSCQQHVSSTPAPDENELYSGTGFTLSHARTISIVKHPSMADFDIYTFLYQGCPILSAYVGNQPDFIYDSKSVLAKSKGVVNGMLCARVQIQQSSAEPVRTHVLFKFPPDRGWPMYMHFWYADLPPDLQAVAEDVIGSLRPRNEGAEILPPGVVIGADLEFPPQRATQELLEKRLQEVKESVRMAREAGKPVDPNTLSWIEVTEQWLNVINEYQKNKSGQVQP